MRSYKWCWPEGFQFSYSETEWKRKWKRGEDVKTTSSGNFLASMERDVWLQSRRGIKWVEASGRQRGFLLMDEIRSHLYGFKDILCRRLKKKTKLSFEILFKLYRTLYIHGHTKLDFTVWHTAIEKAAGTDGNALQDQQLGRNDVPIIVNSCIAFVTQYGKYQSFYSTPRLIVASYSFEIVPPLDWMRALCILSTSVKIKSVVPLQPKCHSFSQ